MQGARAVSLAVAARDVSGAMEGMGRSDKVLVLVGVLAEAARASGEPALFCALVHQALLDRVARDATNE